MSLILSIPFNNSTRNVGLQKNTITSVPSVTPSYIAGPTNNALSFNGSTYWRSNGITLGSEATICFWSKTSTNKKMTWVLESNESSLLCLYENSYYTLNTGDGNTNLFKTDSNASISVLHDNVWHHFAITFGNEVAKLYIDGLYKGTAITFRNPTTTNKPIKIGGGYQNAHSYDWNGGIADFRVYDHCLMDSDIKRIYNGDTQMLQVSLPFYKDCRNVGLENVKPTSAGTFHIVSSLSGSTGFSCARFGPSTGYVKIPHEIFKKSKEMSMTFFINFKNWNTSYETPIGIFTNDNSFVGNTFTFFRNSKEKMFMFNVSNGIEAAKVSTKDIFLTKWYHFVCVYKDNKLRLYQDGRLIREQDTKIIPYFSDATLAIVGASTTGGAYQTDCEMYNVRFYNLALTDEDVQRISKALPGEYQPINFLKFSPGQYINTQLTIAANTVSLTKADIYYEANGSGRDLMGWDGSSVGYWGVTANGTWEKATASDPSITNLNHITYNKSSSKQGTYQIGALGGTYSVRTKYIGQFEISVSNVIQRDMFPCYRKSDKKYGMYDIITRTFYTNDGSGGDFTGI